MNKNFLVIAAFLGAITVAMGAFGAHALKAMVSEQALSTYETAVRYQFYHVFALAITGLVFDNKPNKLLKFAANFFIIGMVFFSGSLYLLTIKAATGVAGLGWAGPITPIGGLFLITGWVLLGLGVKKAM